MSPYRESENNYGSLDFWKEQTVAAPALKGIARLCIKEELYVDSTATPKMSLGLLTSFCR